MSLLDFFSSAIGSIVWPATLIVAIFLLKEPLKKLIPFLESAELLGFKAKFAQEIKQVAAAVSTFDSVPRVFSDPKIEAEDASLKSRTAVNVAIWMVESWGSAQQKMEAARSVADSQPMAAVSTAATTLHYELVLLSISSYRYYYPTEDISGRQDFDIFLVDQGIASKEELSHIRELIRIGAQIDSGESISPDLASLFVTTATRALYSVLIDIRTYLELDMSRTEQQMPLDEPEDEDPS